MDRLIGKLRGGEVCLGVISVLSSPEMVETIGACGFDYVCIDQMATATDWDRTAHMVRAAKGAGLSSLVRVEANPWVTKGEFGKIAVECGRALSLGAAGVMPSVYSAKELAAVLEAARDAHRMIHVVHLASDMSNARTLGTTSAAETIVIPLLESQTTVAEFDDILAVDGLEAVLIGLTDLTRILGVPFQYEHPDVWRMVDAIADIFARRRIVCGASVGHGVRTTEAIGDRIVRMTEHGLRLILVSTDAALFQFSAEGILAEVGRKLSKR
jgi:2-keto-3-deoxy-L-rhamnonate aldolase RhmA